jgi:hypothetical protein
VNDKPKNMAASARDRLTNIARACHKRAAG